MTPTEESSLLREKLKELQTENDLLRQIVVHIHIDGSSSPHMSKINDYLKAYPQRKTLDE